jgi:hypothetical protein
MTFSNAQTGTFSFTNSLFSLDLAASQFGTTKVVADGDNMIIVPVSETITIGSDHTAVLKYVPVGTAGAEVRQVKVINSNNTFGKVYEVSSTEGEGKFTLNAETKTITLPEDVTGRVFVSYERQSASGVQVSKTTDGVPAVKSLKIDAIFHDPCDKNLVYSGVIYAERAQIDPSSVEINLTSDGKHSASYILQKAYCDDDAKLVDIFVTED